MCDLKLKGFLLSRLIFGFARNVDGRGGGGGGSPREGVKSLICLKTACLFTQLPISLTENHFTT